MSSVTVPRTLWPSVTVNTNCQLDRIQHHRRNNPLSMSERGFLDRVEEGRPALTTGGTIPWEGAPDGIRRKWAEHRRSRLWMPRDQLPCGCHVTSCLILGSHVSAMMDCTLELEAKTDRPFLPEIAGQVLCCSHEESEHYFSSCA